MRQMDRNLFSFGYLPALIVSCIMGTIPVLFIYNRNQGMFESEHLLLPLTLTGLFGLACFVFATLLAGNHRRALVFTAITVVTFHSYSFFHQHLVNFASAGNFGADGTAKLRYVAHISLSLFLLFSLAGLIRVIRKSDCEFKAVSTIVMYASAVLFLFQLPQTISSLYPKGEKPGLNASAKANSSESLPHIFHIVLDGYARADTLRKHYNFDNQDFISSLAQMGFSVASNSTSSYFWTYLSLASTLNFDTIHQKLSLTGTSYRDRSEAYELLRNNAVLSKLKKLGYTTLQLESTYTATASNPYVDSLLPCSTGFSTDPLTRTVIERTWLSLLSTLSATDLASCHLQNLDTLKNIADSTEPLYVFAHFLPPHHPYLFDEEGNILKTAYVTEQFNFQDKLWSDKAGYIKQLVFINSRLTEAIASIIERSARPVIFLLHSDHGPMILDKEVSAKERQIERFKNFAAIRLPSKPNSDIDQLPAPYLFCPIFDYLKSPVCLQVPEATHYFSAYQTPYLFSEVTFRDLH